MNCQQQYLKADDVTIVMLTTMDKRNKYRKCEMLFGYPQMCEYYAAIRVKRL